jgi:hypothetical protein
MCSIIAEQNSGVIEVTRSGCDFCDSTTGGAGFCVAPVSPWVSRSYRFLLNQRSDGNFADAGPTDGDDLDAVCWHRTAWPIHGGELAVPVSRGVLFLSLYLRGNCPCRRLKRKCKGNHGTHLLARLMQPGD